MSKNFKPVSFFCCFFYCFKSYPCLFKKKKSFCISFLSHAKHWLALLWFSNLMTFHDRHSIRQLAWGMLVWQMTPYLNYQISVPLHIFPSFRIFSLLHLPRKLLLLILSAFSDTNHSTGATLMQYPQWQGNIDTSCSITKKI